MTIFMAIFVTIPPMWRHLKAKFALFLYFCVDCQSGLNLLNFMKIGLKIRFSIQKYKWIGTQSSFQYAVWIAIRMFSIRIGNPSQSETVIVLKLIINFIDKKLSFIDYTVLICIP